MCSSYKRVAALVVIFIGLVLHFPACGDNMDVLFDKKGPVDFPPDKIQITNIARTPGSITVDWIDPADSDFDHVSITWSPGGSVERNVLRSICTYTAIGLSNTSMDYSFSFASVDSAGNKSSPAVINISRLDIIPPAAVTLTTISVDNTKVIINWIDPSDSDFDHIELTWLPGGSTVQELLPGEETFTATGLANSTEYTFTIASVDTVGNRSESSFKAVPKASGLVINYFIYDADDLDAVRGSTEPEYTGWGLDCHYIMMADIDLSGHSPWTPIGDSTNQFTGTVEGNGYCISGLYIDNSSGTYQGLFGDTSTSSLIKNIIIEGCFIKGYLCVGALAGCSNGKIENCHVISGEVIGDILYVGGLTGLINGATKNSSANMEVTSSGVATGGFTGSNWFNGSIINCYAKCIVTGNSQTGGLIGNNRSTVSDCYATGIVNGNDQAGGLAGSNSDGTISRCYTTCQVTATSSVGGLVGSESPPATTDSYFCGTPDNSIGIYISDPEDMKLTGTFTGWDFTTVWDIDPDMNDGYPYLRSNMP